MRQIVALAWKEWRETRWLVAAGLALFLGLPLVEAGQSRLTDYPRFEPVTLPLVNTLGGVTAVLLGVAVGGRDLGRRLAEFWQAMPVAAGRWWAVKYVVGVAAVFAVCVAPLLVEAAVSTPSRADPQDRALLLGWGPAYWLALFSLGFLAACVIRRPGHAAAAGVAAVVLLYCLPVVLPPLGPFAMPGVLDEVRGSQVYRLLAVGGLGGAPGDPAYRLTVGGRPLATLKHAHVPFVLAMLTLAATATAAALVGVRRGWQIRSGRRTMFAAVGAAVLLTFASAAYQLGTNLPVLAEASLDPGERVVALYSDGRAGVVVTDHAPLYWQGRARTVRKLTVGPGGITLGQPLGLDNRFNFALHGRGGTAWFGSHPRYLFACGMSSLPTPSDVRPVQLTVLALDGDGPYPAVTSLDLWEEARDASPMFAYRSSAAEWARDGDRLYVSAGAYAAAVDISVPAAPKLLWSKPSPRYHEAISFPDAEEGTGTYAVPDLDGLSDEDWLAGAMGGWSSRAYDAGNLASGRNGRLTISLRVRLSPTRGRFEPVGGWQPSLLERWMGHRWNAVAVEARRAYLSPDMYSAGGVEDTRVTVVDFRDPVRPRATGHFGFPRGGPLVVRPLPDGQALIGGKEKVYLVGPPPE